MFVSWFIIIANLFDPYVNELLIVIHYVAVYPQRPRHAPTIPSRLSCGALPRRHVAINILLRARVFRGLLSK